MGRTRKNAADDRIRKAAREGDWQRTWRELIRAGHAPGVVADGELGYRGYSKFSTKGAEILHEWALDGHDVVTSENNGWAGLVEADGDSLEEDRREAFLQALERNDEQRGEQLVIEESEAEEWEVAVGAIVRAMDSGAVYATTYAIDRELQDAWVDMQEEVEPEEEPEEYQCSEPDCLQTTEGSQCMECNDYYCDDHLLDGGEFQGDGVLAAGGTRWICEACMEAEQEEEEEEEPELYDSEGEDA